ncbi:hypothetical protein RN001_000348 [Aquatica leii]|uniref:Uncharacterized protein n=1 Tax=Aquatica leii TaxID=1421715 RepID=A0AAN7Q705_9COLE|nr:hypothetical protein RN001_000348 [Aquatica leii]
MKISKTFFEHKDIHKYTWYQYTRDIKSIIDYFVIKQKTRLKVLDVKVKRGYDYGSDHHLLTSTVYLSYRASNNNREEKENIGQTTEERFNLQSLYEESTAYLYRRRVEQKIKTLRRTVEEEYKHIKACIKEA